MKKLFAIPVAIALVILLAYATVNAYRVPTADVDFLESGERPANVATVTYEVSGLKCRGTSNLFAQQISDVPGVISFTAYARTHTAVVEYDPTLTDPDTIRDAFEEKVEHEGQLYEVFVTISQTAD